ncbi:MAG: hypothetical protein GY827_08385 [Cytophagales bacterium]|nr:hypothetical protein [Cytophagales bacterium]
MKYLNIFVDGVKLDFEVTPDKFYFTYSIKGLEDFTKVGGALTERSLKIPSTNKNDAVFQRWWESSLDNEDASNFKDITIDDGGEFIFKGKCILKKSVLQGATYGVRGVFYQLACYANNTDFIISLDGALMANIPNLPQNLAYNFEVIELGQDGDPDARDYCTGFIKYGNWELADRVRFYECTFLLFLRPLIINLFQSIGYEVQSDFIETEEFKRYCMPLIPFEQTPLEYSPYFGGLIATDTSGFTPNSGALSQLIFDTISTPALTISQPYNTANGKYSNPFFGDYTFKVVLNIKSVVQSFVLQLEANKNGATQLSKDYRYLVANQVQQVVFYYTDTFALTDEVEFFIGGSSIANLYEYELVELVVEASNVPIQTNYPVIPELLLRDYKQNDFLAGVQQIFNLNIEANSFTRIVTIEPADNYITTTDFSPNKNGEGFFNDTVEKGIDTLPQSFLTSESIKLKRNIQYKFKSNDPTSEAIDNGSDIGYNDGVYSFPEDRHKEGTQVIENVFFHKTPTILDEQVRGESSNYNPQFPLLWSENYFEDKSPNFTFNNTVPRIFYSRGRSLEATIRINLPPPFVDNENYRYNQIFMVDYLQYDTGCPALSFSDLTVNNVFVSGLIRRFYIPELKRLQVGKLYELWLFWRNLDISNITFRNKIYLNQSLYIVQQISRYDPTTTESTKTQLLLDAPIQLEDFDNIRNTITNPVIIA